MPGLDVLGVLKAQVLLDPLALLGLDRLEQETGVVAQVGALEDAAGEPVWQRVDERHAAGPFIPLVVSNLVVAVAVLAADQLAPPPLLLPLGEEVDRQNGGAAGHAV